MTHKPTCGHWVLSCTFFSVVTLRLLNKINVSFSVKSERVNSNSMRVSAGKRCFAELCDHVLISQWLLSTKEYWGQVSQDAKNLISSLLTVDPNKRTNAPKVIEARWMSAGDEFLVSQDLGLNLKEFKKFNAKRKFRAAVSTIIATQKLTSLGVDFKNNLG